MLGILNVTMKCCNDLVNADAGDGGLSDPYVTLMIGEHGALAKTKRINNNLNPVFNEQHKLAWNGTDPLKVYIYIYIYIYICILSIIMFTLTCMYVCMYVNMYEYHMLHIGVCV